MNSNLLLLSHVIVSLVVSNASGKIRRIYCRDLVFSAFVHSNSAHLAFGIPCIRTSGLYAWLDDILCWRNLGSYRPCSWNYRYLSKNKRARLCFCGNGDFDCLYHLSCVPCSVLKAESLDPPRREP